MNREHKLLLDRVTDLEIRSAHQEAALDELTRQALRQQRQLNDLLDQVRLLTALLKELSPSAVGSLAEESPPPHY